MIADNDDERATRRGFLVGAVQLAGGIGLVSFFPCNASRASPDNLQAAIKKTVGAAPPDIAAKIAQYKDALQRISALAPQSSGGGLLG